MKWLKRLFSKDKHNSKIIDTQHDDRNIEKKTDVLTGVEFFVTLQIRTPLDVLNHHGEIFKGSPSQAPNYSSQADGIWIPKTKSWADLGFDIEEMPQGQCASDIGVFQDSCRLKLLNYAVFFLSLSVFLFSGFK